MNARPKIGAVLAVLAALGAGCDRIGLGGPRTGQIHVTTDPEGAVVQRNGARGGLSPTTLAEVPPGTHLIAAAKEGYREARKTVSLFPGQKTAVDLRLEPVLGLVLVRSDPPGAEVQIGGAFRGKTPLLIPDFPLGAHRVKVRREGYLEKEIELTVEDRIPRKVDVELVSDSAKMVFRSTPAGARVMVNGAEKGVTPCEVAEIPTGEAAVEVVLDGHYPFRERILLRAGETREIDAALKPMPGTLTLVSIPDGARVYLDNEYKGQTPLTLEGLQPGSFRVRVESPGYAVEARTVEVTTTDSTTEEFRLVRNSGLLVVVSEPAGARVFVDGKYQGTTSSGESDVVSEPLEIDLLPEGQHSVQLSKKGYTHQPRQVVIQANKVVSLHERLARMFIPDTLVRFGSGASEAYSGVLLRRHPNGDVDLEVQPGVIVKIEGTNIVEITPLRRE